MTTNPKTTDAERALEEFNDYDAGVMSFSCLTRNCKDTIRHALESAGKVAGKVEGLVAALKDIHDNSPMVLTSNPPKDYAAYRAGAALAEFNKKS